MRLAGGYTTKPLSWVCLLLDTQDSCPTQDEQWKEKKCVSPKVVLSSHLVAGPSCSEESPEPWCQCSAGLERAIAQYTLHKSIWLSENKLPCRKKKIINSIVTGYSIANICLHVESHPTAAPGLMGASHLHLPKLNHAGTGFRYSHLKTSTSRSI